MECRAAGVCQLLQGLLIQCLIIKNAVVYLKINEEIVTKRLQVRRDHFMPTSLIHSQFEALEEPNKEEALHVNAEENIESVIQHIIIDLI